MKTRLASLALLALLVPVLAGCGKEPTAPEPAATTQAPAVPPAASMKFDLSFFDQNGGAQARAAYPNGVDATQDKSNWINAVVRVVFINLTLADLFSAPAQALHAALSQQPVLGDDGWFTWTYTFTDDGHNVSLRLRGRVDGAIVTWRMYATDPQATPALNDFLWFSGETRLTNDSGFWVFNDRRDGAAVAVARIDWNATGQSSRLTFRNVEAGSPDLGDEVAYQADGAIMAVRFHDVSGNQDADITWNEVTGAGSLMVPDYNGGLRACWDEAQENRVCPSEPAL